MAEIKIKNRTSGVHPNVTAGRIETMLASAGASNISKRYENSELVGIDFTITTIYGVLSFRLPVNVEGAYQVLSAKRYLSVREREKMHAQAARTAWKLAQDSLEIQLSQVAMKQAELVQVLFPNIVKDGVTLFDVAKTGGYAGLLSDGKNNTGQEAHRVSIIDTEAEIIDAD